jgi:chemotaxis protein MotB
MAAKRKPEAVEQPKIVIVKKIIADGHGGHHGGAWKVAYADFVTAMMAFFLLLWILGATTEKQRKGIADYFAPTLVEMRQKSSGANGPFGGDSVIAKDKMPHRAAQTGTRSLTIPKDSSGGEKEGGATLRSRDRVRFQKLRKILQMKLASDPKLKALAQHIRMTETLEGLRIDLVDEADFTMFASGTATLLPVARTLIREVAGIVSAAPNPIMVRGHTDALPYSGGRETNNWTLSASRAESTRKLLAETGIPNERFARIEGVADREPYAPDDIYDPKNRRMSITLGWSGGPEPTATSEPASKEAVEPPKH